MEESGKPSRAERLEALRLQAFRLVEQLQALTPGEPDNRLPWLLALIGHVQQVVDFGARGTDSAAPLKRKLLPTQQQLHAFGKLLRDKRNAAGLSRVQLARKAKLSDATIKFVETARHLASRATLIRLIAVEELKLTWADAPGSGSPPAPERSPVVDRAEVGSELNCLVPPTYDPVRRVLELGRFLNGAGGHVKQTGAYLDPQSAAAYLAVCQQSAVLAGVRASTPLAEAARRIGAASGPVDLHVIALGAGAATLEVRLVQHLLQQAHAPRIELCLLDISQPLLACGLKHAAETWAGSPAVRVWGLQSPFHDVPLLSRLVYGADPQRRRVVCMLGGTVADLDHEARFFQHALAGCSHGDLLLLDLPLARGVPTDPAEIKRRDAQWAAGVTPAEATWLGGPLWRHGKDVVRVEFHWDLDTRCPMPGSYALDAVATVHGGTGTGRQFSMFRFRRYAPDPVTQCLRSLGWEQLGAMPFGGRDSLWSLGLFCKRTEPFPHE